MKIISNSAISLDGRLAPAHDRFVPLGSREDRRMMSVLRNRADAVLVGGNSFRTTPVPLLPKCEHLSGAFESPLRALPYWNVVVSRTMDFTIPSTYLHEPKIKPLFMTAPGYRRPNVPCEVLVAPEPGPSPQWIVRELAARGVETLLIEAGGDLIYQFLAADLLDDLYLTICPLVIGRRGAPALVDGTGFVADDGGEYFKRAQLVSLRQVEDELFLHYRFRSDS